MDFKRLLIRLVSLIFFIFLLNYLAMKFYWYSSIWYLDMPMHFLGGVWLGLIFIWFFKLNEIRIKVILKIILCVLLVGILWEFFENIVNSYIFFIRGTPLLVQFFLIYYGIGQFTWLQHSFLWIFFKSPFCCAMLTLALNTSAYSCELFTSAINSVPKGELDACKALGMSGWLSLRRIIAPHAWRLVLPAYSNEIVMLVKASSLASTITMLELMGMTQQLINRTFLTIEFYCLAGFIYLIINNLLLIGFKILEKNLTKYSIQHQ